MANDHRKNLHSLSNQMVDLFVGDIFSKNKVDASEMNLSDEQKEALKQSFLQLKEQVDQLSAKQTTEENVQKSEPISPLMESFLRRRQQGNKGKNR